ncbi:MAG: AAA family ATPase [Oscillospiraceae bacterium]|nr:AAA family ATPase [Oscillospiraceae bacterium]
MRIYRMTATFGKLEHAVLELKPGMNIIEAPNEWGKSTWCAFLLAMLYGLDTRAKSTRTALADKERFAPWSGSPMAGRIDLCWNGRDITLERTTRGRVPMGTFRAYETNTGLEVPELTAANCGTMLLGVEQTVFRRAGFIRQTDMPVTQDEALRRRLNDLVTTGDETGDADRLAKELKELKNKCRYNRSGLLPQAEAEARELEERIGEWDSLENHCRKLKQRIGESKSWLRSLENHMLALDYAEAEADAARVAEARDARDRAESTFAAAEADCTRLPSQEEARNKIQQLQQFQTQWNALQLQLQQLPLQQQAPSAPEAFRGKTMEACEEMLQEDTQRHERLRKGKVWLLWILAAALLLAVGILFVLRRQTLLGIGGLVAGGLFLALGLGEKHRRGKLAAQLEEKYGSPLPEDWRQLLQQYRQETEDYQRLRQERCALENRLEAQKCMLENQRQSLCGSQTPQKVLELWQQVISRWERYSAARRELEYTEKYLNALQSMVKKPVRPAMEDALTYSRQDTQRLITDTQAEQQRLLNRLGQYQGRMESLGERDALCLRLEAVQQQIGKLEAMYQAASLGLETLNQARQELQRRFAPRISKRAQELLGQMTGGRYDRLNLSQELSLLAGARQEDTLRDVLWRSDGTVDQLYFALRLAVAEELTPEAPLILDDAFVRFDDIRLKAALEILREEARHKQVILFTCQSREKDILR